MSERIKNVGLYSGTLNDNMKFPIGNTGEDTAFTLNMGQVKTYMENHLHLPYSNLTGAPQIGNATIEIHQDGALAGKFTLNQTDDMVINITGGGGGGSADWGNISGDISNQIDLVEYVDDKLSGLATVARTGSYTDLSNKPTIGNGSIVLRQGGVQKGNFTMNQTGNLTVDLEGMQYKTTISGNTPHFDVKGNIIYICTGTLTSLTFDSVENSQFEADIYFTTGSSCTLNYPNTIDGVVGTTALLANKHYIIAIKDNRMVISYDGFDPSQFTTTVTNNNPTLAYGQAATIGSVNGTSLTLTMPAAPTVPSMTTETWTFTLSDDSTITRTVYIQPAS